MFGLNFGVTRIMASHEQVQPSPDNQEDFAARVAGLDARAQLELLKSEEFREMIERDQVSFMVIFPELERKVAKIWKGKGRDELVDVMLGKVAAQDLDILMRFRGKVTRQEAEGYYRIHRGKPYFESLVENFVEGPADVVVVYDEMGEATRLMRLAAGPIHPRDARATSPWTISAMGRSIDGIVAEASDAKEVSLNHLDIYRGMVERWMGEEE